MGHFGSHNGCTHPADGLLPKEEVKRFGAATLRQRPHVDRDTPTSTSKRVLKKRHHKKSRRYLNDLRRLGREE